MKPESAVMSVESQDVQLIERGNPVHCPRPFEAGRKKSLGNLKPK